MKLAAKWIAAWVLVTAGLCAAWPWQVVAPLSAGLGVAVWAGLDTFAAVWKARKQALEGGKE